MSRFWNALKSFGEAISPALSGMKDFYVRAINWVDEHPHKAVWIWAGILAAVVALAVVF